MQWPVTRILLYAFWAAVILAILIIDFAPGGGAIRPTLNVLVVSLAIIGIYRAYQRNRGNP